MVTIGQRRMEQKAEGKQRFECEDCPKWYTSEKAWKKHKRETHVSNPLMIHSI